VNQEIEVRRIEDAGQPEVAPILKMNHGYRVEVVYVLSDGQRLVQGITRRRLREARAYRASLPIQPQPGSLYALLNQRGDMIGTKQRFAIGARPA
jgi:hypothetical protein